MHLWQSIAFGHTWCNLLILRATNLRDQEVEGSNPFAPTTSKLYVANRTRRFLFETPTGLPMAPPTTRELTRYLRTPAMHRILCVHGSITYSALRAS
jgi:hypothetical protein